jgi:hypothetical protein
MSLRRTVPVAFAAVLFAACEPSLPQRSNQAASNHAVFDPANGQLPSPNDLAILNRATTSGAQRQILEGFAAAKGYPNDQEVPILVDVQQLAPNGAVSPLPDADPLDVASINAAPGPNGNVIVLRRAGGDPTVPGSATGTPTPVPPAELRFDYVSGVYGKDRGTLEIHNAKPNPQTGSLAWDPATQYLVLVRGGASGVKTKAGNPVDQMATMFLLTRGVNLADPKNQTLASRGQTGIQLEQLRQGLLPLFGIAEQVWGPGATQQIVAAQAFTIAPAAPATSTAVLTDPSASKAIPPLPLPSDFLLDPKTNRVVENPAFCLGNVDAQGSCALARGLATLDGFSTTGLIAVGTTAPSAPANQAQAALLLDASTVNPGTVFLYDLSNPAQPQRVKGVGEAGGAIVVQPPQLGKTATAGACASNAGCFSPIIGLQPAVPVPLASAPNGVLSLPPLKEKTEYAVIVTDGVKNAAGQPLRRSSTASVLLLDQPLADADGKPLIGGQPVALVPGLEKMRQGVAAAVAALQAEKGITRDHVVLGYTFRTQTITDPALDIAAAPYQDATKFVPGTPVDITAVATAAVGAAGGSLAAVQEVLQVPVATKNPIDPQTGALNPNAATWPVQQVNALVAVPKTATGTPQAPAAVPLVVFQHGFTGDKTNALAIMNTLAAAGFASAAIDAPLHGDRSLCAADADCACPAGLSPPGCAPKCNLAGPFGGAGGAAAASLGTCGSGSTIATGKSGAFFVSANLFMTRDALRQSLLDVSALILDLAPTAAATNPFATELASKGIRIDPTKVYMSGQSLGGILSTLNTAADPRISRAVLNVPGGTLADVFSQSPSFQGPTNALLASLGITPGTPQFLLFINTAKWILDPGDPINFAGHLLGDAAHPTLPNRLASNAPQAAKNVLGQFAICDQTIPNPFNLLLFDNIGLSPGTGPNPYSAYTVAGAGTPGACTVFTSNPAHVFLLRSADTAAITAGQTDLAAYLASLAVPAAARP